MALKDIINWFTGNNARDAWPSDDAASNDWPYAPTFGRREKPPAKTVHMELTADSKPDVTAEAFFADARREMERMRDEFSKGKGGQRMPLGSLAQAMAATGLKIEEVGNEYRVAIDLPGFVEKEVTIEPRDRLLIVRAEQRSERTSIVSDDHLNQRVANKIERILSLSAPIDPDHVTSTFVNGTLHVTLPKKR